MKDWRREGKIIAADGAKKLINALKKERRRSKFKKKGAKEKQNYFFKKEQIYRGNTVIVLLSFNSRQSAGAIPTVDRDVGFFRSLFFGRRGC